MRVNIGCGQTPTPGWRNFDNSPSLRLARLPVLPELLLRLRILKNEQYSFIRFARSNSLEFANAAARIPLPDESVEALYSSHMFEHLSPAGVSRFLNEALRVLKKGGIIRLAVPDLRVLVSHYLEKGDADDLLRNMDVFDPPSSMPGRILRALVGVRHHQWMYDGPSLCRLLARHGFRDPEAMPAGRTRIPDPGALDLSERADESVYVEAERVEGRI